VTRRRIGLAAGAVVLAGGAAALALTLGGGESPAASTGSPHTRTAAVTRRDLVARVTIDGTLGYADAQPVSGVTGTVTWVAPEGAVVRPGHALYRVDDQRVLLLSGRRPAWRAFGPGMSAGRDVLELERNLKALGDDPYGAMTVDGTWTAATTAAVKRLQDSAGLTQTGRLDLGRVVFLDGARRVSKHDLSAGDTAGPGRPVLETTSTRREVTASLSTDDQGAAKAGDRALVDLPNGGSVRGRITSVGAVAHSSGDGGGATIDVTVELPRHGVPPLDQAPVSVEIARERVHNAVAVPIVALLAKPGGGYGVELVGPRGTRIVAVTPGLFADGYVQVDGVQPGERVAVPE